MRGKGTGGGLDGTFYKDHPRLCGEKTVQTIAAFEKLGSPPPMRGKAPDQQQICNSHRITPAYAGKRTSTALHRKASGDHPRLCGEKLPDVFRSGVFSRITPAYAGKRGFGLFPNLCIQDHPRLCGEKLKNSQWNK